ncbi:MAG: TlpA disulfide reductase family protein [candidate division WOR-3 bacterium]
MKKLITILIVLIGCGSRGDFSRVNFSFKSINGEIVDISKFKGKVLVVDFWATWCPPCLKEIPHFIELQDKYKEHVQFVGLNVGEKADKVREFANNMGINYIIGYSEEKIEKLFGGISGLPTTFIVGKDGKIKAKAIGYRPKEWFESQIISALRE